MSEVKTFNLSIIADRYALALMEVAEKHNELDKFDSDLALIKRTVNENKDLKDFLEHPLIQAGDKNEVISSIFGNYISVFTLNLIKLLIGKNRVNILSIVSDHYRELLCKKRNISTAKVITAVEIDEAVINRVREKLEKMFSKTINIETSLDKEIIAGMIVKIGDKVIDGSIKTKLEKMKKQLI